MKVFGRDYIKTDVARGGNSGSSEPSQYEYQLSKASKDDIVVGKVTINRRDQVKYSGTHFHRNIRRHIQNQWGSAILLYHRGKNPVNYFSPTRTCQWHVGLLAVTWQVG
jgi:hypothetical protein